jgi:pSer/pThr/pTyr-binding forkhead associated (FHA) protein
MMMMGDNAEATPATTGSSSSINKTMNVPISSRIHRRRKAGASFSWLFATGCSSAIVASLAYVHKKLTLYLEEHYHPLSHQKIQEQEIIMEQLSFLHMFKIRLWLIGMEFKWILVWVLLGFWLFCLILFRQWHLHFPLIRFGNCILYFVTKITRNKSSTLMYYRYRNNNMEKRKKHSQSLAQKHHGPEEEEEIDEMDLLIVSSLAPQRKIINISQENQVDAPTESDTDTARILLNPREGAKGGRHPSNQIILDDPYVSRFHFQIKYDSMEKEYFLQDLGSITGTFIYLRPNVPKRLKEKEHIKLGETEFEVVSIEENINTNTNHLRIRFTEGPLSGMTQTIGRSSVTLGRKSTNALCISDDTTVSGKHCMISFMENAFFLTDLQSTNGTAVRLSTSGDKSRRRWLIHGDVFGIGSHRFLVEYAHQVQ